MSHAPFDRCVADATTKPASRLIIDNQCWACDVSSAYALICRSTPGWPSCRWPQRYRTEGSFNRQRHHRPNLRYVATSAVVPGTTPGSRWRMVT